jgi:hypothetical protein
VDFLDDDKQSCLRPGAEKNQARVNHQGFQHDWFTAHILAKCQMEFAKRLVRNGCEPAAQMSAFACGGLCCNSRISEHGLEFLAQLLQKLKDG